MGNCCKSFAREANLEENPMESAQMPSEGNSVETLLVHSEGNENERTSSYSNTQAITALPTHARRVEKREQGQDYSCGYHPGFVGNGAEFIGHPGFVGIDAELIAAGWPSWMVKDAHEAFVGWLPRKEKSFKILDKVYFFSLLVFLYCVCI